MVTRILLASTLCLMPAFAAAQVDTGSVRDIAAIHHLIEQYAKAVDTVDLNLLSQIWSHSPEVSFIYPWARNTDSMPSSSTSFRT
jgi:hypothetical protein